MCNVVIYFLFYKIDIHKKSRLGTGIEVTVLVIEYFLTQPTLYCITYRIARLLPIHSTVTTQTHTRYRQTDTHTVNEQRNVRRRRGVSDPSLSLLYVVEM